MADFWQLSGISTLHLLQEGESAAPHLHTSLQEYTATRPLTVVIPCHARDVDSQSLERILQKLATAPWVAQVILGLDAADSSHQALAETAMRPLADRGHILWWQDPARAGFFEKLNTTTPDFPLTGKGRNVWLCLGWLREQLAGKSAAIALLDADIRGFELGMLARLAYPVLRPDLGYKFCKAYYARFTDQLHGRLTRLLLGPLLESWEEVNRPSPLSTFFKAFRYPLSGEIAFHSELIPALRFPASYGMELGVLSHVFETLATTEICQAGICHAYDHHHQELQGQGDEPGGLELSAQEVSATLADLLGGNAASQTAMETAFRIRVCRALHHAASTAALNGLEYQLDAESKAARVFSKAISKAKSRTVPWLPAWDSLGSITFSS
jgi:glucosyl-3-phosphoglycerate synthase